MESTDRQKVTRISRLQRLANSGMGNPRYRVHFADGTSAETATNGSVALTIRNSEHRVGDVLVTFNPRGKIIDIQPAASNKVALARQLLDAHDALQAAHVCEPPSDDEGDGLPLDPQAWLNWKTSVSDPAYADWKTAMDAFREAVPHHGIGSGRHPLTFRIECEAIIAAGVRGDAP